MERTEEVTPPRPRPSAVVVAVAAGGALGALLRAAQMDVLAGAGPAAGTLLVNVVGSLALGALLGLASEGRGPALAGPLVGVGIYGAYTTFATFEAVLLGLAGRTGELLSFLAASLALGLAAAVAGQRLGRHVPRRLAQVVLAGPLVALVATSLALRRVPTFDGSLVVALAVGGGGAAGALCRAGAAQVGSRASRVFPWGTLAVNVTGSLLIACVDLHGAAHALVVTGWLGGLTTFSTFACEAHRLLQSGRPTVAAAYVSSNVLLGLAAAAMGAALSGRG